MGYSVYGTELTKAVETSSQIKALLMNYFRFDKNYLCVTSEMWNYSGRDDFVAINNKGEVVCVEIKTSKSDFLAEFKNKKKHTKLHQRYNKFYFCVTRGLESWALEKLDYLANTKKEDLDFVLKYPHIKKYGLMVADTNIHIAKKANTLDDKKIELRVNYDGGVFYDMLKSMSCELTKAYAKLYLKDIIKLGIKEIE